MQVDPVKEGQGIQDKNENINYIIGNLFIEYSMIVVQESISKKSNVGRNGGRESSDYVVLEEWYITI